MDFIERLRQKPTATKRAYAIGTSAAVTLVIFGLWASVFHFGGDTTPAQTAAAVNSSNNSETDVNPLSAFWDVISSGWNGLTNNINDIKSGTGQAQDFVNLLGATTSASSAPQSTTQAQSTSQNDVFYLSATSSNDGDMSR